MKVISNIRKRKALEEELGVDVVKIGSTILKVKFGYQDGDDYHIDEDEARSAFTSSVKKIEQVRNISSPILKVITLSRCMDDIMGLIRTHGEIGDADDLLKIVFYVITILRGEDCAVLGARFIEEMAYIDSFLHEDQISTI